MLRPTIALCLCALSMLACDKPSAPADKADSKSADAKTDAKPADAKTDAKTDDKPADAKTEEKPAEPTGEVEDDTKGLATLARNLGGEPAGATDGAPTYDTSKDAGGLIGHLATALAHDEALGTSPAITELHVLAGEPEQTPADGQICKHVWTEVIAKAHPDLGDKQDGFLHDCKVEVERQRLKLGVEIFAQHSTCVLAVADLHALELCDAAAQQAEEWLHKNPKGDQPQPVACNAAVEHFVVLLTRAMVSDPDMLEVLQEDVFALKDDAILVCHDEATATELACIMKAPDLKGLEACRPSANPG